MTSSRGALIVLEGCDRAGKTTQAKKLVDALNQLGRTTKLIKFPGKCISYIKSSVMFRRVYYCVSNSWFACLRCTIY